jgi:predicted transcriptional regulator
MARNLKSYYQAWELRQHKLTFKEIGKIMGLTGSRVAVLSNFIDFKIENQKRWRISNELKELVKKCLKNS